MQSVAGHKPCIDLIQPYWMRDTRPAYTHICSIPSNARIITLAGQVGSHLDGTVSPDYGDQIRQALENLRRCLEAAGATINDVTKVTTYMVDYDGSKFSTRIFRDFFGDHSPPWTLVPVPALALPKFLFEIDAMAAIPEKPLQSVDVVVVGGGLSGLQAAVDVQKAGFSCVVLEARDRVGGKTWSRPVGTANNVSADVGAAWINESNQSKMYELVQKFGLTAKIQNVKGNVLVEDVDLTMRTFPYGEAPKEESEPGGIKDMIHLRSVVEEYCQRKDPLSALDLEELDGMTVVDFLQKNNAGKTATNTITAGTRAMLGVEPSEMSALYFLEYCKCSGGIMRMRSDHKDGGQYMRIQEGTQSFSKGLASLLTPNSVELNSPVRSIEQTPTGTLVSGARGSYLCKRVIVSVPTPLYKEIRFEPPLTPEKLQLSKSTRLGYYAKIICMYESPWWREVGFCGLSQSVEGPYVVTRDTSVDEEKHFSLTCFICGEPGRRWSKLSKPEREKAILAQLERMYAGIVKVPQPIEVIEQEWIKEQWSQGCPCPVMGPGLMSKLLPALSAPHGHVHFVGTEMADVWRGYMEGAVRSGERGAEEVVWALKGATE